MENKKVLWKSKTLWVNFLVAIAAFFPQVKEAVTPETIVMLLTVINMVLRLATKDKVVLGE